MTDTEVRIECLRQASLAKLAEPDTVVKRANAYYLWVTAGEDTADKSKCGRPLKRPAGTGD